MRIFVDVGAHYGETLHVALDPIWHFDRIIALEPAAVCQPLLAGFRDPRLTVLPFGLGSATRSATLYGAGELGASIHPDKPQKALDAAGLANEEIQLVRASDWFARSIPPGAEVFLKFNCEGSECDILDDLLDAGLMAQIAGLYIDFDVRKIASQAHRQHQVEERLDAAGVPYVTTDRLGRSANAAVVQWLDRHGLRRRASLPDRARFALRTYAPRYVRLKMLAETLLPRSLYWWLGRRFGRLAWTRR